ncbi:MAG: hypothetical protein QHC78_11100 [Pigmentiphaga sp.]|uniref:hypothetical protein n=1 Tax=Pigmentiphaga sp. TaxID=1977564 RepID=UPI0029B10AA4|nr:hypothetical protein [Pigmentiphaga sp.]MDX3906225.1 hypothetical protein [Pigmentiphaga sp.]
MAREGDLPSAVLSNEFAAVRVSIDTRGLSPRLRVDDLRHDRTVWLDAFQLAALAGTEVADFDMHMIPGRTPGHGGGR